MTIKTSIQDGDIGLDVRETINAALSDIVNLKNMLPGIVLRSGNTAPANGVGNTGDFYINTTTSTLYGPKAGGVWPAGVSLLGPQGIQGVKGDIGTQGIQGVKGDTGLQGIQGIKGDTGTQGIQGVKGDTGTQGVKGDTGLQGIQGPKGDTGLQGIQGVKGDTGTAGTNGADANPISTVSTKTGAYTLVAADSSTIIRVDTTANVTVTLPNTLPAGFQVAIVQSNTGVVSFAVDAGGTLINRQSYTKTGGRYAIVTLIVTVNPGNAPTYILTGDGAL